MDLGLIIMVISGAVFLVAGFILQYNIYQMTKIDAKARGLKHPKLLGLLNISGNNGNSFLLAYLIGRKKYPVQNISNSDLKELELYKKKSQLILFINISAVFVFIIALLFYKKIIF